MACSARVRIALLAVCQEIPRAAATRQTDMRSRARARSPPHDCRAGQPRPGPAKVEASCLHTRRQRVQAKRRRRTTSCVGLHPTGTWARRRATVPRACPRAPQTLQNGSSNPIGMRQSISARLAVTQLAHRRQSQNLQAQQGRQIRTGESSLRHVETSQLSCVAAPIIGGSRPLTQATTHPPHLCTSRGSSYHTLIREEPVSLDSFVECWS